MIPNLKRSETVLVGRSARTASSTCPTSCGRRWCPAASVLIPLPDADPLTTCLALGFGAVSGLLAEVSFA